METKNLEGAPVAQRIREDVIARLGRLQQHNIQPGLAVVIVGEDPASQLYVGNKAKTCRELGMYSEKHE
ncbi:MAG: tetrahydrofolate dehydrogenase/cyclohydrolase catalytic domain-containing protein, partial [Blastocatellia bacterium]